MLAILGLAVACAAPAEDGESATEASGRAVIDRLVDAAGGVDALDAIETLVVRYEFSDHRRNPATGVFEETGRIDVLQARDFQEGRSLYEVHAPGPPERWERVVMLPGAAFTVDLLTNRTSVFTGGATSAANYSGLLLRWYVYFPITQARMAGPAVRLVGDTLMDDRRHDVVAFSDPELGEVRLYIDRDSSRLRHQRWHGADLAARRGSMSYEDYRSVGGIPIPFTVIVRSSPDQFGRYEITEVQLNAELRDSAFRPPAN